jgi:hypothetical protein
MPIAQHSWGWLDGVAVTVRKNPEYGPRPFEALSILIRAEVDDPWSAVAPVLHLYTLEPNPDFVGPLSPSEASPITPSEAFLPASTSSTDSLHVSSPILPYIFPPTLCATAQSVGGSLQCTNVISGPCGTAVWIHPRDRASAGLVAVQVSTGSESLIAAAFPGPLNDGEKVETKTLWMNPLNDWTSIDYDENMGRIALGSRHGKVTLLDL